MKLAISVLCFLLTSITYSYAQILASAYQKQDIKILEDYLHQYRCVNTTKTSTTLDSMMFAVINYMNKQRETKIKNNQYVLLQPLVRVSNYTGDDFSAIWNKPQKWNAKNRLYRSDVKKQEKPTNFVTQSYQCLSKKEQVYFVPPSLIKQFDDFINLDSTKRPLPAIETSNRARFIGKKIKLTKLESSRQSFLNVYYFFEVEQIYFNKSKSQAILEVSFNISTKEVTESRYIELLYFSNETGAWKFSHKRRIGWL